MTYRFESRPLTRYLSFSRFVAMLELGLFVPKASLFEDHFEGVVQFTSLSTSPQSVSKADLIALREWCYVSCWYDGEHESHAMWGIYGSDHEAVAIQTDAHELIKANWSFPGAPHTYFDQVRYVNPGKLDDFKSTGITVLVNNDEPQGFLPAYAAHSLYAKHVAFQHEKEIRLVAVDASASVSAKNPVPGQFLSADASRKLIRKVFIHPYAPAWFEDSTRKMLARYMLDVEVMRSSLHHTQLQQD